MIKKNISLLKFNTFGIDCIAKQYIKISSLNDLVYVHNYIKDNHITRYIILGGGSNIILPNQYDDLIIHNCLNVLPTEPHIVYSEDNIMFEVNSGVSWDVYVGYCVKNNYFGLENLSLIPGTVGAALVQNIGAYGAEVKDYVDSVEIYDIQTNKNFILTNQECEFKYRDSIFKKHHHWFITKVIFKLKRKFIPNINYKDIANLLHQNNIRIDTLNAQLIRDCVIQIRTTKLPDYKIIGNVGSFFHNAVVNKGHFLSLQTQFDNMPFYQISEEYYKIPSGWLIENLNLKGYTIGGAAVYEKHALIIVNKNKATQNDVILLAQYVIHQVQQKYGILLTVEPIIIS